VQLAFKEQLQKLQQIEYEFQSQVLELESQKAMGDKLAGRLFDLESEVDAQKTEIGSLKKGQAQGTSLEVQLQSKIESDAKKIGGLRETIGIQEERISRVQEDFFRIEKKATRETMEEKALENYIRKEVVQPTNEWACDYAVEDIDLSDLESLSPELWSKLQQMSQEVRHIAPGEPRQYEPQILLNAILAHYIAETVIQHPFLQLYDGGRCGFVRR